MIGGIILFMLNSGNINDNKDEINDHDPSLLNDPEETMLTISIWHQFDIGTPEEIYLIKIINEIQNSKITFK